MSPMTFGAYFKERREATGLGLRAFARAHGFTAPTLSDIERGRDVPLSFVVLARYATALGLDDDPEARALLFDLAAAHHGIIPADLMAEPTTAGRLLAVITRLRGDLTPAPTRRRARA